MTFNQIVEYVKQIVTLRQNTQKNTADILEIRQELKEMRREIQALSEGMREVVHQVHRNRDTIKHQQEAAMREILVLRLENQLLKFERRLPPPQNAASEDRSE